jgi:nicotinamidase-related amidase
MGNRGLVHGRLGVGCLHVCVDMQANFLPGSPWTEGYVDRLLAGGEVDTPVITGEETDVCALATVIGAVDRGYRAVIAADAVCGSADETHDAAMTLHEYRFSEQVDVATTEEILASWR